MPDFGSRWKLVQKESIGKGGQGNAYLVSDAQSPDSPKYVAKVLNGKHDSESPRWKRLEEEIEVSKTFDHPNVVRAIDAGHTSGSGYPFFVMPFYSDGSLQGARTRSTPPGTIFNLFAGICDGVAHIHKKGVVHRDIKPANIFLDAGRAVVGDLGLCFRVDAESLTETMEVAAPRWFGAPELRNGHLEVATPSADVYSLGKLLYWMFTGRVFDREEQDYDTEDRRLRHVLSQKAIDVSAGTVDDRLIHAGAFADDVVAQTVRYTPATRIQTAGELASTVRRMAARFECGGRALDLSLPQRCLFCGNGLYKPVVTPPNAELRGAPPDPGALGGHRPGVWANVNTQTNNILGQAFSGRGGDTPVPLSLVCDYCGNLQHFRWEYVREAQKRWRP